MFGKSKMQEPFQPIPPTMLLEIPKFIQHNLNPLSQITISISMKMMFFILRLKQKTVMVVHKMVVGRSFFHPRVNVVVVLIKGMMWRHFWFFLIERWKQSKVEGCDDLRGGCGLPIGNKREKKIRRERLPLR